MMNHRAVEIGALLAGKYRVERVLGEGGMGVVVQATHLQLQQAVAMKFLLPAVLGNQQIVQRFLREAQAAVRLKSEHVARVIDVGSLETGAPYMVLEYLDGVDLSNFPRQQLTIGGIVDLMLQACEALAEAHALGIVHRDIKPANFFITRSADGTLQLKVLDFGISKTPLGNGQLTATQAVMGTPAYMSPEQMRSSRDVDPRSDLWSLGVVLYELLQGAPPFGGNTFSSMVIQIATEPLPKLTVRLPGDLDAIVYRCLEKDPAKRFQNIAELAQALAKHAQSPTQAAITVQRTKSIVGANAPRSSPELAGASRAFPSTLSGSAGAATSSRRRRWPLIAAIGLLGGAGAAIAIAVSMGGGDPEPVTPAAGAGSTVTTPTRPPAPAPAPVATQPPPVPATPAPLPANPPTPEPAESEPTPEPVTVEPAPEAAPPQPASKKPKPPRPTGTRPSRPTAPPTYDPLDGRK